VFCRDQPGYGGYLLRGADPLGAAEAWPWRAWVGHLRADLDHDRGVSRNARTESLATLAFRNYLACTRRSPELAIFWWSLECSADPEECGRWWQSVYRNCLFNCAQTRDDAVSTLLCRRDSRWRWWLALRRRRCCLRSGIYGGDLRHRERGTRYNLHRLALGAEGGKILAMVTASGG